MSCDGTALKIALELVHLPSQIHHVRSAPLPRGVHALLEIASGDEAALASAVEMTGRPQEIVRAAARFFIEQVLFAPDADSYRVLGATPDTGSTDLRRNMGLLMRWLHPDTANGCDMSIFAGRVTRAWDDLKTPERRLSYDEAKVAAEAMHQQRAERRRRRSTRAFRAPAPSTGKALVGLSAHDPIRGERDNLIKRALAYLLGKGGW